MSNLNPLTPDHVDALKSLVGNHWRSGNDAEAYREDPRDNYKGISQLVLMPSNTETVSKILAYCNEHRLGVVPYSGGTGVVAGQLSTDSQDFVVISSEKMNAIRSISIEDNSIVAEAGCILSVLQDVARENGRLFPLAMASEGSCRIGGNLATNAGGIQVLRYGNARDNCLGVEAVMADGTIVNDLTPLRKDNTGYDLRHLLTGSEGTLGYITAATLSLSPLPTSVETALCGIPDPSAAVKLLKMVTETYGDIASAFELMSGFGLQLVGKHVPGIRLPFDEDYPWYCLIDFSSTTPVRETLEAALGTALEDGIVLDAVLADSESQRQSLWDLREKTPEANRAEGAICNSDTSVPISQLHRFIELTNKKILDLNSDHRTNCYGHIGDGNIHFNVFAPDGISKQDYLGEKPEMRKAVRMAINDATHECHGSISAEHGIGRLKIDDLVRFGDPGKLMAMKAIKNALDPKGILNPGVLFAD